MATVFSPHLTLSAGDGPVLRTRTAACRTSNQNGAPKRVASAAKIQPMIAFTQSPVSKSCTVGSAKKALRPADGKRRIHGLHGLIWIQFRVGFYLRGNGGLRPECLLDVDCIYVERDRQQKRHDN